MGSNTHHSTERSSIMAATLTFEEALKATQLPEAALAPVIEAWNKAFNLIVLNNKRIAQINASKAQDPNNTEYIDSLWEAHYNESPEMVEIEAQFQAVTAERERLLKELRDFGRTKIEAPLSEDDAKKAKAAVNESKSAIETARAEAAAMTAVIDSMLNVHGKAIEGGIISLMPQIDSLKNLRGRKAGGSDGKAYMTRVSGVDLNGESTNVNGKGKFTYAADKLSENWGAATHPENKVTGEELEEAFFKHLGKGFRELKSTEIPDAVTNFDFTKEITTGENTKETKTVKVTVHRYEVPKTNTETPKAESKPAENETPKNETNGEKVPAPAKANEAPATPAKKVAQAPAKK